MQHEIVFAGGLVVDGTGSPAIPRDVAVDGAKVSSMGPPGSLEGVQVIDARGARVTPGFIDIHSHADWTLLVDGRAQSSLLQGITTVVIGNCGHGPAPSTSDCGELALMNTFGCRGAQPREVPTPDFGAYLAALREARPAVNIVPLIPHGTVRLGVAGFTLRPLSRSELRELVARISAGMEAGAGGLSTGLEYSPGIAADEAELIAACGPVGEHGGVYATHCRNRADGIIDAAQEAVNIAAASGCRLQMSHFVRRPFGSAGASELERRACECVLEAQDTASVRGRFDVFPFEHGPTPLAFLIPQSRRRDSRREMASALLETDELEGIEADLPLRFVDLLDQGMADDIYIASDGCDGQQVGRTLKEVADDLSCRPVRAALMLLQQAGERFYDVVILDRWAEADALDDALASATFALMGDGITGALDGPLADQYFSLSDWAWVPKVLAHYVRDLRALTLEDAVRRMTSLPAQQAGIEPRGTIRPDAPADLVVLRPDRVGSAVRPDLLGAAPTGIEHVLVNGRVVVSDGQLTNERPGLVGMADLNVSA